MKVQGAKDHGIVVTLSLKLVFLILGCGQLELG